MEAKPESKVLLSAHGITKSFGGRAVLLNISFEVRRGETFVVMGPSGCGKSTLLKILFGAEPPDEGTVTLDGIEVTRADRRAKDAARRRFGVLFQDAALLGSLSVGQNVALPIRYHTNLPKNTIDIMSMLKLRLVGLEDRAEQAPSTLSGGQKKRAGLARALALDPPLVFCDEPSSGLDPVASAELDDLLIDLKKKMGLTAVVVTHDVESAFKIGDRMLMLHQGDVAILGTSEEVRTSSDERVRQFIERRSQGPISMRTAGDQYLKDLLKF